VNCQHENIWYFWSEFGPTFQCVNCEAFILDPVDVSKIVNVPHYPSETCTHIEEIEWRKEEQWRDYKSLCLNCGATR
jgi:formylmethanofuran dehydrogenase subunit E